MSFTCLLAALSIAAACGDPCSTPPLGISMPGAQPGQTSALPPLPKPACYPSPTLRNLYVQTPPFVATGNSSWTFSVIEGKLLIQTNDGMQSRCERMTLLVNGADPAEVSVSGTQLKVVSGTDCINGTFLQANADRVTRTGVDGALLTFKGNAKLVFARQGKKADVSADRVSLNLATGQITCDMGTQPVYPPAPGSNIPCPVTPVTSTGSSPPQATTPVPSTSSFWGLGFFH